MNNGIAHLLTIQLSSETVRLSDGGFLVFGGNTYFDSNATLGSISSVDPLEAGSNGSISAVGVEFNSAGPTAVAALSEAALRNRPITTTIVEYDPATGAIVGTAVNRFVGQIDQATSRFGPTGRTVGTACTSLVEPIFSRNTGNAMSHEFQQLISPGDTGHAQGTGLVKQWAWGTASVNGARGGIPNINPGGGGGGDFIPDQVDSR